MRARFPLRQKNPRAIDHHARRHDHRLQRFSRVACHPERLRSTGTTRSPENPWSKAGSACLRRYAVTAFALKSAPDEQQLLEFRRRRRRQFPPPDASSPAAIGVGVLLVAVAGGFALFAAKGESARHERQGSSRGRKFNFTFVQIGADPALARVGAEGQRADAPAGTRSRSSRGPETRRRSRSSCMACRRRIIACAEPRRRRSSSLAARRRIRPSRRCSRRSPTRTIRTNRRSPGRSPSSTRARRSME